MNLDNKLSSYKLVKLDPIYAQEQVKAGETLKLQSEGQVLFELALQRKHLRIEDLKLEVTSSQGTEEIAREEGVTYEGTIFGDSSSTVRMMLDGNIVEGSITRGEEIFFVTPAKFFAEEAGKEDLVVYTQDALIDKPLVMNEPLRPPGNVQTPTPQVGALNQKRILRVATEADYAFVQQMGGATAANNYIMSVINMVDALYEKELGISIEVTAQHAWTTPDPYNPNNQGDLSPILMSMMGYWNQNRPQSTHPRDVAHLFSGRWQGAGLAFVGVICQAPQYAYGLSVQCNNASVQALVAAHELGHNLGADHADGGECSMSLMNPMLRPGVSSFCQPSRNVITGYVAQFGACLGTESQLPEPQPEPLPVPPVQEPIPEPPAVQPPVEQPPAVEEPPVVPPVVPPVQEPVPPVVEPPATEPPVEPPVVEQPPVVPPVVETPVQPPSDDPNVQIERRRARKKKFLRRFFEVLFDL